MNEVSGERSFRVLVVGAGPASVALHLPVLAALRDSGAIELTLVCDLQRERAAGARSEFKFLEETGDAMRAIERPDIDVVYIFSSAQIHYEYGLAALRNGKHVFVEKPVAPSYRQALELAQIARAKALVAVGGHNRRFYKSLFKVRAHAGAAKWRFAEAVFHKPEFGRAPLFGARTWLGANGIHGLDALVFMMGGLPEWISAQCGNLGREPASVFSALMRWPDGAQGMFLCNNSAGARREEYVFHGMGETYRVTDSGVSFELGNRAVETAMQSTGDGVQEEHDAFLRAIRAGHEPLHSLGAIAPSLFLAELIEAGFTGQVESPERPSVSGVPGTERITSAGAITRVPGAMAGVGAERIASARDMTRAGGAMAYVAGAGAGMGAGAGAGAEAVPVGGGGVGAGERARTTTRVSLAPARTILVTEPAGLHGALSRLLPNYRFVSIRDVAESPGHRPEVVAAILGRGSSSLPSEILDKLPEIKVVGVVGLSLARFAPEDMLARGIALMNASEAYADSVAEFAFALAVLGRRRAFVSHELMRAGGWGVRLPAPGLAGAVHRIATAVRPSVKAIGLERILLRTWKASMPRDTGRRFSPEARDLRGATVGLLGWGANARAFAKRLREAGCRVLVCSEHASSADLNEAAVTRASIGEVLASDIVSLHRGLSENTRHFLGTSELAKLRPGAVLINVARGALIEPGALLKRVARGDIFACLDTYDDEPLRPSHPLRRLPNVFLTSHIAGGSADMHAAAADEVVGKVAAHLVGSTVESISAERLVTMS